MKVSYIAGAVTALVLVSCYDAIIGSPRRVGASLSATRTTFNTGTRLNTLRSNSWVTNALSRQKKEETVADLKQKLEKSSLVFGMNFNGFTVKQVEGLRKKLPEDAKIQVAMNTLMRKAGSEVEGYEAIEAACKGDNAWWFAGENVASCVKAYLEFEEECKKAAKADPETKVPTLSGGCMDGTFLDTEGIKALKNLPTRTEVIAKIAGSIKAVPTKLARSVKQVPTKVAIGISKLEDGDDNKDLIVGDIFPKAETEA
mmetsp:Transcript_16984/g.23771  ORF Transcript_16984/g.23771 Transcript_16984/m.23771 type:complete len:257 (+) Transcript_16984:83-853(+)|eukprot:CAMPEP_0185254972 /NCGR_PEP_ID=MMETSP1359-20130426/3932_1 /TAXON_ID=552665 /ORGANISM="Bigelowiella longifila, Strain CCMP242" /LENGTH=256 /DNA_ID=CAMNT_0027838499 /DNA_START=65 /DNA_END=835 /DNA_ORIENTATION=+